MATVVVLDTNELQRDWMCTGPAYQLLYYMGASWPLNVRIQVPAVVVEELAANRDRAFEELRREFQRTRDKTKSMGLIAEPAILKDIGYREYLLERFDSDLSIDVLDWPEVKHEDLARRAVHRIPPFNNKGTGYRDSLVWADVLRLAATGNDVALVTRDKVFAEGDKLASKLQAEIEELPGSVSLVTDLGAWLLPYLPWSVDDLSEAITFAREDHFGTWFSQSDFISGLIPQAQELGFDGQASWLAVDFAEASDGLDKVSTEKDGRDESSVDMYDLPLDVHFEAIFAGDLDFPAGWDVRPGTDLDSFRVSGDVPMVVRLAVRYERDTWYVDQADFRRAYGTPFGQAPLGSVNANQTTLFSP